MTRFDGPILILVFCLSQALRDVYFAHVFQGDGFFTVVALAFSLAAAAFLALSAWLTRGELLRIWRHGRLVLWMNLTTALAWSCYFVGLKYVEPSVVNTIHSGMGPLTALALGAIGGSLVDRVRVGAIERAAYVGIALSILALWVIVLSGASGLGVEDRRQTLTGLAVLFCSGASITISLLLSKKLHDAGFGSITVTAVRYLALVAVATVLALGESRSASSSLAHAGLISISGLALIVAPTFVLQMGVARTPALLAQVVRSLGPVFVFALELVDGRVIFSRPVLFAILVYSVSAIAATLARRFQPAP